MGWLLDSSLKIKNSSYNSESVIPFPSTFQGCYLKSLNSIHIPDPLYVVSSLCLDALGFSLWAIGWRFDSDALCCDSQFFSCWALIQNGNSCTSVLGEMFFDYFLDNFFLLYFLCSFPRILLQMSLDLWWFDLQFFDFMMVWKQSTFSRNCTSNFGFWSFPGLLICRKILSCAAWQRQQTEAPSQPPDQRVNNWYHSTVWYWMQFLIFFYFQSLPENIILI